eukprot:GAHX01000314.1.p1 GENE.GAHX01000314.1~~GAHX01000314.1.p1  ORF type:complete len:507 (-),score=110.97 GAHX01000314.1:54-1532(-)
MVSFSTVEEIKEYTTNPSRLSDLELNTADKAVTGQTELKIKVFLERSRKTGSLLFLLLRNHTTKIQAIVKKSDSLSADDLKEIASIPAESYIELEGSLSPTTVPVETATIKNHEIKVSKVTLVSAVGDVPFQLADSLAAEIVFNKETRSNLGVTETSHATVSRNVKFDNRVFDLRLFENHNIFSIRSFLLNSMRSLFLSDDIKTVEVQTPKLLNGASESGSTVFEVKYFKTTAFLAQSPQLYKQMLIISGFPSIFEVGPVFRAEDSNTHKHLTEYTGLDMEMRIENDYNDVLDRVWKNIRLGIKETLKHRAEEVKSLNEKFGFDSFAIEIPEKTVAITYTEAVALLQENKVEIKWGDDIGSNEERLLGELVKEKFKTDLVVITQYPNNIRAFYTKKKNEKESYGYDFIFRGEEIISGAERENNYELLLKNMKEKGMDENDKSLSFYLDAFKLSVPRHGGIGMGFDRLVGLFLGLRNIRNVVTFPRDPSRLTP